MADSPDSMRIFDNRLASFEKADHPAKKHQSSQGKGAPRRWPHETPTPAELAAAGFYFEPLSGNTDNTKCFHCKVHLDGWEIDDVPLKEHLAHSANCAWAVSRSVTLGDEDRDPLSEKLLDARLSTFEHWPHEGKKGWKCTGKKMAEGGWCMDTGLDSDDGATCFYCNLALDGWEPKDDPLKEHKKRNLDCPFFTLITRHASTRPKKSRARNSTASKASRLSTQSIQSTFSEAPSLMSLGDAAEPMLEGDTSIGTVTSTTSTTKGRKKAAAGMGRGKKKAARQASVDATEADTALTHLDESMAPSQTAAQHETADVDMEEETAGLVKEEPAKKSTRGRPKGKKAAAKQAPPPEVDDHSQLQTELAASVIEAEAEKPAARAKRGKKRTSDGEEKAEEAMSQPVVEEAPVKPKKERATRAKKGKAAQSQDTQETEIEMQASQPMEVETAEEPVKDEPKPKKGRKPKATKQAKAPTPEPEVAPEEVIEPEATVEDAEDESANYVVHDGEEESEANYVVHDESSVNFVVHDHTATIDEEHEPSPTPAKAPPAREPVIEEQPPSAASTPRSTHSHQSSDAENHPPSSHALSTKKRDATIVPPTAPSPPAATLAAPPQLSPTKTTRIPLSSQTPNRSPRRSPTKLGILKTSTPWSAIDIETIFFPSGEDQENTASGSPGKKMVELSGGLQSPEKKMTVEEWVRWQAGRGEERLREECERVVWLFEREGRRAMGVLQGVEVGL